MKSRNTFLHCSLIIALCSLIMVGCNGGGGGGDPALTGTVSIDGTAEVDQTLTAITTALDGSGDISYQWKQNPSGGGTATVIGADSVTYIIADTDIGSTITVTVTRTGYSGSKTSTATAVVTDPNAPPLTGTVTIDGYAEVGQTLTAITTALGGEGTISYQWKRNPAGDGTPAIIGANSSTYQVQSADIGSTITVTVTRTGNSGSKTSPATSVVPDPNAIGTLEITIAVGGDVSIDNPLIVDGVLILNRSDEPITLTIADSAQYDNIRWRVQGSAITGSGAAFELDAGNPAYLSGKIYFLTVEASRNGVLYDYTISFKVEEE